MPVVVSVVVMVAVGGEQKNHYLCFVNLVYQAVLLGYIIIPRNMHRQNKAPLIIQSKYTNLFSEKNARFCAEPGVFVLLLVIVVLRMRAG